MSDLNLYVVFGIVAGYFALILGVILISRLRSTGRITPSLGEFLLANRDVPSYVLSFTFVASLFSTAAVIAFPSFVYAHGIGGIGFIAISEIIGAAGMVYYYNKLRHYARAHDLYSPIECLSHSYDSKLLGVGSVVVTILFLMPYIALQLVAIGAFLTGMTDGALDYVSGVGLMMTVVLIYILFGGMRAVAYTDVIQGLAILIGFIGGAIFLIYMQWGGFGGFIDVIKDDSAGHFTLPGPNGLFTPLYFVTSFVMAFGIFFQPHLLTRGIMARDKGQLKVMAYSLCGAILVYTPVVLIFGVGAYHIYGDSVNSNAIMGQIFSDMALVNIFGLILSVLFLVGALGAAMSTADSILLSIGQMITRDIVRPYKPYSHDIQVWISRFAMGVTMALAFVIGLKPPEFMIDLALASIAASAAFLPVYLGFNWAYRSKYAAMATIICGESILLAVKTGVMPAYGMHEGFLVLVISGIVYVGWCAITAIINKKKMHWR